MVWSERKADASLRFAIQSAWSHVDGKHSNGSDQKHTVAMILNQYTYAKYCKYCLLAPPATGELETRIVVSKEEDFSLGGE